jgi:DNA-binding SARP family transcriptional activator/tetratricopeptide (TPR) repeat protein
MRHTWKVCVRYRLLGPLRVRDGTTWSPIRAAQQRVVLAVLLATPGQMVSSERLVAELWGDQPPKEAHSALRGYIMRLRRALGDSAASRLVTRGHGYELVVPDGEVDAVEFESRVVAGRRALAEGSPRTALEHLDDGLALWHGPALADVPPCPTVTLWANRLAQSRLTALEERAATLLSLGRHGDVVDELTRLVAEHPFRERLWELLMRALRAAGRRAEALEAYRTARRALAEDLGLEPGPALRDLHRSILAERATTSGAEPAPARVVPAQLPAAVAGFTGREQQLDRLHGMLATNGGPRPVLVLATITGTAGIGKTALAVHWAHQIRDRYPDGQLYANLRGYDTGPPLRPLDVLSAFLPALGVPSDEVPATLEPAAALYRSLLADRRVLVVLDNARHPSQVRPLLPGGAGCLALVTSRDPLGGLVARDGAVRVGLDVLAPAEARDLLVALLGQARVNAEPAAAARLAALCGHLPLALRIAAANLDRDRELALDAYAAQLAGDGALAALEPEGDPEAGVRAAFEHSYTTLPEAARTAFRRFGLVPGPDVTVPAMAALAGVEADAAARAMARLASAGLLDEMPGGRFGAHDLLRRFAGELAAAEDGEAERAAAVDRLMAHYQRCAEAAATLLYPVILRLPSTVEGGLRGPQGEASRAGLAGGLRGPQGEASRAGLAGQASFTSDMDAAAWLDAELVGMVAAIRHTAQHGPRPAAWRLADALRGYLYLRMHVVDWEAIGAAALTAARAEGDALGEASARLSLGTLQLATGRYDDAIASFAAASGGSRLAGWHAGEAAALTNLGNVHLECDRLDEAAEHYAAALDLNRRHGRRGGEAGQLANLALVQGIRGQLQLSADNLGAALALHRQIGSRVSEARNLANLGDAYHRLGRLADATAALTRALAMHRELGDRRTEGSTMCMLATVHRDSGRLAEALELASGALARTAESGDRPYDRAEAVLALAGVQRTRGEAALAAEGYRRAVALARQIGNRYLECAALIGLAGTEPPADAAGFARTALLIARERGYRMLEGNALTSLAAVELWQGLPAAALACVAEALVVHAETGHRLGAARTHLIAAAAGGDGADAHREQAERLLSDTGAPVPLHAGLVTSR